MYAIELTRIPGFVHVNVDGFVNLFNEKEHQHVKKNKEIQAK